MSIRQVQSRLSFLLVCDGQDMDIAAKAIDVTFAVFRSSNEKILSTLWEANREILVPE